MRFCRRSEAQSGDPLPLGGRPIRPGRILGLGLSLFRRRTRIDRIDRHRGLLTSACITFKRIWSSPASHSARPDVARNQATAPCGAIGEPRRGHLQFRFPARHDEFGTAAVECPVALAPINPYRAFPTACRRVTIQGETPPFLSGEQREEISNWWLAIRHPRQGDSCSATIRSLQ